MAYERSLCNIAEWFERKINYTKFSAAKSDCEPIFGDSWSLSLRLVSTVREFRYHYWRCGYHAVISTSRFVISNLFGLECRDPLAIDFDPCKCRLEANVRPRSFKQISRNLHSQLNRTRLGCHFARPPLVLLLRILLRLLVQLPIKLFWSLCRRRNLT